MIIGKSLYPLGAAFASVNNMQARMEDLQIQLATGKKSHSLSQLGNARSFDMTIRSRQSRIEAFQSNISMVDLRLDFLSNTLARLDEIEADSRGSVASGGIGSNGSNMITTQTLAGARLDEVITLLNSEVNGRFLLSGGHSDRKPVASLSAIMDGEGGRDGFRTVVGERKLADAGADGKGRLINDTMPATTASVFGGAVDGSELLNDAEIGFADTETFTLTGGGFAPVNITFTNVGGATSGATLDITVTDIDAFVAEINVQAGAAIAAVENGEIVITANDLITPIASGGTATTGMIAANPALDTVSLSEDGAHPFGYKLSTVSTSSAAVSLTSPSGTPASLEVQFTGVPVSGEKISIGVTLPDGETHVIEFVAVTGAPVNPKEFQIDADVNVTAANFSNAISTELNRISTSVLEASSTYAAADNFFNASGDDILRVDGPPFDSAVAYKVATDSDTVSWYNGEDSSNARQTVRGRVDESTNVNYGVQANETGMVDLMRALSALSVEDYPDGDASANERFTEMTSKQLMRLAESNNNEPGSIELIALELGIARASNGSAKERHNNYSVQLANMLAEIEEAPIEQVAMELLSLQTRLQASYQTMSAVSQLTLVNYIK